MSQLPMLIEEQFERIKRYFPCPNGVPRVRDRRGTRGTLNSINCLFSLHVSIFLELLD